MTVQQIINLALSNCHTKSSQVSAANLILFFNLSRNDVAATIRKDVNEDFFFQIWTIDAEDNTNADKANGEYLYPTATSSTAGMKKLINLMMKGYSTDTYFTPCTEKNLRELLKYHDWTWYMVNQSKSDPIYYIADESVFIAPEFKAADLPDTPSGNEQLKLYGIATITDLAATDVEATVLIPEEHHDVIALGMEKYIYKARGKKKEAFDSLSDYGAAKQDMIDALTNRDDSFMQAKLPDDTALQYGDGIINE